MRQQAVTIDALDDALLKAIAARGGIRTYPPQTIIVTEGERSNTFYIVISGTVKLFGSDDEGNQIVYATHGKGEYFGEMTLDGGVRAASVMTTERTTCAVVSGEELRDFIAAHPDFALNLIYKLIRIARASTLGIKNLALLDVYGRVCVLLASLATDEDGVQRIRGKLTQQDIAERVGSSREMVSRIFRELVSGGYIALEPGLLTIHKKLPSRW